MTSLHLVTVIFLAGMMPTHHVNGAGSYLRGQFFFGVINGMVHDMIMKPISKIVWIKEGHYYENIIHFVLPNHFNANHCKGNSVPKMCFKWHTNLHEKAITSGKK